jgi:hypothetical protein
MARSVNDRLQDETIAHGLYVTRYGTGVARRMVALLNKLDADLAAKLLVLLDGKRADTYSARRLASLLAGVRDLNQQAEPVNAALARELARATLNMRPGIRWTCSAASFPADPETCPAAEHRARAGLRLCGGAAVSGAIAERVGPKA